MIVEFKKMKLRSNQEYDGVVRDVRVNEKKGTMWIFVELDEVKNQNFMKSFPLVLTEGSILWDFLNENELLDRKGKLDTDLLIDREVVVTLSKGKDSNGTLMRCISTLKQKLMTGEMISMMMRTSTLETNL